VKERLTFQGIIINATVIPLVVEYKTRLLAQIAIFVGLDLLRDWLQRCRRLFSQEAGSLNLPQPKGVLLARLPGTGKSINSSEKHCNHPQSSIVATRHCLNAW
jgi:hypothetical protein